MKKLFLATVLAAASISSAFADGYVGGDLGRVKITDLSSKGSFNLYGGYAFKSGFPLSKLDPALELGYRSLGSYDINKVNVKASAIQLSTVFNALNYDIFSVYGRLGVNRVKAIGSAQGISASETSTKFLWGLGLESKLSDNVSARLEYQKPASDTYVMSLGAKLTF